MAEITKVDIANGQEITIKSLYNQITVQALFSFINDGYSDFFTQEFKYSINGGGSFTSYQVLTENNVRAINTNTEDDIVVTYKFVRIAEPVPGADIVLRGAPSELIYPIYDNFYFKEFFELNDIGVLNWALNVLEKLYARGELAEYLERNKGNNIFDDEDFISFWGSVCHTLALFVNYGRKFQEVRETESLLKDFLNNIGVYFNANNTLEELQYLYDNYIDEFKKRGTNQITNISQVSGVPNGELLRLVDYLPNDEFIFCLTQQRNVGWNIGNSSPCYAGTEGIINCIKAYESGIDVTDLSLYPLENQSKISLDSGKIKIENVGALEALEDSEFSGLSGEESEDRIVVSNELDYEVSFRIIKNDNLENITFGIDSYDKNGNTVPLVSQKDGTTNNLFFENKKVGNVQGEEYWVRGVIFRAEKDDDINDVMDCGYGNNLKFTGSVNYIIPRIRVTGSATANEVLIRDVKIRPRALPFSQGSLGARNLIINWIANNSGIRNVIIDQIIKLYLVPYNSTYYGVYLTATIGEDNYLLLNTGGYVLLNSGGRIILNK